MALDNKYRVHEVAKDFGVSTKEITEILTKYRSAPKNHMQVLDDTDLSVIFEYLTQHNQVSDMEGTLNAQQEAGAVQGGNQTADRVQERGAYRAAAADTEQGKAGSPH